MTNKSVFALTQLPQRLGVIGAGPIGCELAQAFARFGSQVDVIETGHGIMPNEDRDAAEIVEQQMLRDGVTLLCCGKDLQVEKVEEGKRLIVESHAQQHAVIVDEILLGVRRTPNVERIGLEAAGVEYDRNGIVVNRRLQTTNPKIFSAVASGAKKFGYSMMDAVSGAGHDAVYMARLAPAGMVFVPCKDGISHNELEDAKPEHLEAGCNVLLHSMLDRAGIAK